MVVLIVLTGELVGVVVVRLVGTAVLTVLLLVWVLVTWLLLLVLVVLTALRLLGEASVLLLEVILLELVIAELSLYVRVEFVHAAHLHHWLLKLLVLSTHHERLLLKSHRIHTVSHHSLLLKVKH